MSLAARMNHGNIIKEVLKHGASGTQQKDNADSDNEDDDDDGLKEIEVSTDLQNILGQWC